jgi:Flp pilus assembly protein TadG
VIRRFAGSRSGIASIEFALVGSVFLMALLAVTDFGRLMFTYHALADAARQAARYAIVHGASSSSPASTSAVAAVAVAATSLVTTAQVTVAFSPDNSPGSQVTVTIVHPFTFLFGFISSTSYPLTSKASQVIAN